MLSADLVPIAYCEDKIIKELTGEPLNDKLSLVISKKDKIFDTTYTEKGKSVIEVSSPMITDEVVNGFIRYTFSTASIDKAIKKAEANAIKAIGISILNTILIIVLVIFGSILAIKKIALAITSPISGLVRAAENFGKGDLKSEISSTSKDEVGTLARVFEIARINTQELIGNLLGNMPSGMVMLKNNGQVSAFKSAITSNLVDISDLTNISFAEVFRFDLLKDKIGNDCDEDSLDKLLNLVNREVVKVYNPNKPDTRKRLENNISKRILPAAKDFLKERPIDDKFIDYEFTLMFNNNTGEYIGIMLNIIDVTQTVIAKKARKEKENENNMLLTFIKLNSIEFNTYIKNTTEIFATVKSELTKINDALLKERMEHPNEEFACVPSHYISQLKELVRITHTAKADANPKGFMILAEQLQYAEDILVELSKEDVSAFDKRRADYIEEFFTLMNEMEKQLEIGCHLFTLLESRDPEGTIKIQESNYRRVLQLITELSLKDQQCDYGKVLKVVKELEYVSFSTLGASCASTILSTAQMLQKTVDVEFDVIEGEDNFPKDALVPIQNVLPHLLKNSVSHGIEDDEIRFENGKEEMAKVVLKGAFVDGMVKFIIQDNGAGIISEKVVSKAIEKGILNQEQATKISYQEVCELIFAPGFTTTTEVTSISGRGEGLAEVKTTVEKIGGTLSVTSIEGQGTKFEILFPYNDKIV